MNVTFAQWTYGAQQVSPVPRTLAGRDAGRDATVHDGEIDETPLPLSLSTNDFVFS
jgi:hypothetical protein